MNSDMRLNWEVLNYLRYFGNVTSIGLPGYGGMDSFRNILKKPSLNNYADYLSSILKLRYKNKKFIIVGQGFGFIIATRTLQKYPNIARNVKLVISIDGSARHNDIKYEKLKFNKLSYIGLSVIGAKLLKSSGFSKSIQNVNLFSYSSLTDSLSDFHANDAKFVNQIRSKNDLYTHINILLLIRSFDNSKITLNIPLWNIILKDSSIIKDTTENHLKSVYNRYSSSSPRIGYYDLMTNKDNCISKLFTMKLKKQILKKK
jgi:pimeloyl-ACP methyl ester carboxylesterase